LSPSKTYRIDVPASTQQLGNVREFVTSHAREYGFNEQDVEEIRLAVDEAMTNVIKHAYGFDESKTVNVSLGKKGKEFWVAIQDEGDAFDIAKYKEPNVSERIKYGKKGGVGVYLIRKLMDKVEYSRKNSHNEIKMTKKL
jgi:serine/threonine-protein kinase RsbW